MEKHFGDISEYYVGHLAEAEEAVWKNHKPYLVNAAEVKQLILDKGITRVVEVGCGSGWVPTVLPTKTEYLGIDANDTFLGWAREKNSPKTRRFIKEDVRKLSPAWLTAKAFKAPGLVCSFAVMKHFGLHEWDKVLKTILSLATYSCVDVQVAGSDFNNGTLFHHTFVSQEHADRVIEDAGHKKLYEVVTYDGTCPEGPFQTKIVVTRKANE